MDFEMQMFRFLQSRRKLWMLPIIFMSRGRNDE